MTIKLGECDACGKELPLRFVRTTHGEANACALCRGESLGGILDDFIEYLDQIFPDQVAILEKGKIN